MTEKIEATRRPGPHPELTLIAAHADRRLAGEERARVEEHLARCSQCFEIYAETIVFKEETTSSADWRRGFPGAFAALSTLVARPAFRIAAGIAAVLLLALPIWLSRSGFFVLPSSPVAELVQAVGERRLVEPRLTGGFRYSRLLVMRSGETPQGLDAQPAAVIAAVARIRERAEKDPTPEALGALGVTYLVSGDVGAAVKALESATNQKTDDPQLWSDLAAAYLERARQADEPADIPKALEAAERAVALPDPPTEAWFNRALALEALHLDDAARKAWEDYLARDASSGWADEARQHIEALATVKRSSAEEDKGRVRAALEQGPAAVDRLAEDSPQTLRDYLDDDLLSAWAEATIVGNPDANRHREQVRVVGEALARTTTDVMTRHTARALAEPISPASRDPLRSQAQGFRALFEARRLYDHQMPSCDLVRGAARQLETGGSPYAAWARFQAVIACFYPAESEKGLAELDRVEAAAEPRGYVQLLGRIRQIQGLFRGGRGELTASLERYRAGLEALRTTRDGASEAKLMGLLAENLQMLGENREAWRARERGLALLRQSPQPLRRYSHLNEAASACLYENRLHCSLQFQRAAAEFAFETGQAAVISEALVREARLLNRLGDDERAAARLRDSRGYIERIADPASAQRARAEADRTEAEISNLRQPELTLRSLDAALGFYQASAPVVVPPLLLLRSRAHSALGDQDAAEADLLAGIEARESHRATLGSASARVSFFDQAFPLFEEMVRLQISRRGDPDGALDFVERGHARQLMDSLLGSSIVPMAGGALRRELPEGVALIFYVPLEDRLLTWALSRDSSHFVERPLTSEALARRVAAYRSALESHAPLAVVQLEAGRLHDDLVRPLLGSLAGQRALVFVPDGVLASVPFASLWDRQTRHYLVEDYLLGLAPSGTVFVEASRTSVAKAGSLRQAVVVGNPRFDRKAWAGLAALPGAEAEATEISELYPEAVLLTGSSATKTAFLAALPRSQVVHFAGHASASADVVSASRLLFAPEPETKDLGALYLRELDRRRLPGTRVVVLAACRTAAGAVSRVEGALSLGRPFLASGVPNVVASLWDIEDSVSRRLFVAFHRALVAGSDPVGALREAQLLFVRDPNPSLAHPSHWAALVCMGGLNPHSLSKGVIS